MLICTTSKSAAVSWPRLCKSSLSQRSPGAPLMYMFEPLSAMIIPYCCSAVRITWFAAEKPEISKLAFNRRRIPIGAALAFVVVAAQCDAGGTKAARLFCNVKRSACLIAPLATSSYRASPANTDSPAASAEVHVSGRCPSASKSHTAAEAAFQLPSGCGYELYSSYNQQVLLSSTRTWRSPLPGFG